MKKNQNHKGFTLVEILVVITITIVLAALVLSLARGFKSRANAARRMADVRQSGNLLLAKASDRGGRCEYFAGGASGGFDVRPYNIVREALNLPFTAKDIAEIMHWDIKLLPPTNPHWTCYAVNFQVVPDLGANWKQQSINYNGSTYNVKTLNIDSLTRPGVYPLLIDSSTAAGEEIFRILESNNDRVGLRSDGKANAFLFDGSCRQMDRTDLKKAGFTKAFDNSSKPPKAITL